MRRGKEGLMAEYVNLDDLANNSRMKFDVKRISVKGLSLPVKVMQLTDMHMTEYVETENIEFNDFVADRQVVMENSSGRPYEEQLTGYFDIAQENEMDLVLLSGDIMDFPSKENIDIVTAAIHNYTGKVLFVLGNHDICFKYPPHETRLKSRLETLKQIGEEYCVRDYGFVDVKGMRFITLDNSSYYFTNDQYLFLKQQFRTCALPIVIMFHIPIFLSTLLADTLKVWKKPLLCGGKKLMYEKYGMSPQNLKISNKVIRLMEKNNKKITNIITGHLHFDHEDIVRNNCIQYVCKPTHPLNENIRVYEYHGIGGM
jgi:predicted MPP superfamily phosphohydrolase